MDLHFWQPEHGGLVNNLDRDSLKAGAAKSPPGKVDHHTAGAFREPLRIMDVG